MSISFERGFVSRESGADSKPKKYHYGSSSNRSGTTCRHCSVSSIHHPALPLQSLYHKTIHHHRTETASSCHNHNAGISCTISSISQQRKMDHQRNSSHLEHLNRDSYRTILNSRTCLQNSQNHDANGSCRLRRHHSTSFRLQKALRHPSSCLRQKCTPSAAEPVSSTRKNPSNTTLSTLNRRTGGGDGFKFLLPALLFIYLTLINTLVLPVASQHCFGYPANHPSVCSSHGACVTDNNCNCDSGYGGSYCQKYRCGSYNADESGVCSGRGVCTGPNTCACTDTSRWGGAVCEVPKCNGILGSDTSTVCSSGKGVCQSPDSCACYNAYPGYSFGTTGSDCESTYCAGLLSSNGAVCSSHGSCQYDNSKKKNYCQCTTGYVNGPSGICELVNCYGKLSNQTSVCGGVDGAVCSAPDNCVCPSGYTGTECGSITCGGVISTSGSVCDSRGTCVSPNNCECITGWRVSTDPSHCDTKTCNGLDSDNLNVCSGHGTCNPAGSTPDVCSCSGGYTGQYCETWSCGGIDRNDPTVCGGYGTCVASDTCDYPVCFGISASVGTVCSNRQGRCVSTDNCYCPPDEYIGQQCQVPVCFSVPANDSSTCSSHGACDDHNQCFCTATDDYVGVNCEVTYCSGIRSNVDHEVCGGHGTCWPKDECTCDDGWVTIEGMPHNCSIPICHGITANDTSVCNGKGTCIDKDTCSCTTPGYFGTNCEVEKCLSRSATCNGHGDCDATHEACVCDAGWTGENCTQFTCYGKLPSSSSVCSGKGKCVGVDTCVCDAGWEWTGPQCNLPGCFGYANQDLNVCGGKGDCVNLNDCQCNPLTSGYKNSRCENPGCFDAPDDQMCSNHGECVSQDNCQCEPGWTGSQCEIYTCYGVASPLPDVCSSHGTCIGMDNCLCAEYASDNRYTGNNCQYTTCFGIDGSNLGSCSGHGQCISPDPNPLCNCTDPTKWTGTSCQLAICYGLDASEDLVCSGRGDCVSPQHCICTDPYATGDQCQYWTCNGTSASDPTVCHGHGVCDKPNQCTCDEYYAGQFCDTHYCYGIINTDNETVCSGHGVCSSPNVCECDEYWTGDQCEYTSCGLGIPEEVLCHYQGNCTSNSTCDCNPDYYGAACDHHISHCSSSTSTGYYSIAENCTSCADDFRSGCMSYVTNFTLAPTMLVGTYFVPNRKVTIVSCSLVLPESTVSRLGSSPICRWSSLTKNEFKIILGTGHTVTEQTEFSFNLLPFDGIANLWSSSITVVAEDSIQVPVGPTIIDPVPLPPNLTWVYVLIGVLCGVVVVCCLTLCLVACVLFSFYSFARWWNNSGSSGVPMAHADIVKPYVYKYDLKHLARVHDSSTFEEEPDYLDDKQFQEKQQRIQVKHQVVDDEKSYLEQKNAQLEALQKSDQEAGTSNAAVAATAANAKAKYVWNDNENRYVPASQSQRDEETTSPVSEVDASPSTPSKTTFANVVAAMTAQNNTFSQDDSTPDGVIPFDFLVNFDNGSLARQVTRRTRTWLSDARSRLASSQPQDEHNPSNGWENEGSIVVNREASQETASLGEAGSSTTPLPGQNLDHDDWGGN